MDLEETLLKWTDERDTKSSVVGRQEPMNGVKSLKYATQTTASVWMPFNQTCNGVSGDADFDSFKMAPWDAGGIQGDKLHNVMYRPVIVHELDRRTTRNTEINWTLIDTNSPRLTVTPGECHASHRGTRMKCDLRRKHDTSAMTDGYPMKTE